MSAIEEHPESTTDTIQYFDEWESYFEQHAICLIDGAAGIYVPQEFAERYEAEFWNIDTADMDILKDGPNHPYYWETWDYVLSNAYHKSPDGTIRRLYQDSDLFTVPDMHE